jgi:Restriction alleviation protein Lar
MKIELEPSETVYGCPMCGSSSSLHGTSIGAIAMVKGAQVMPQGSMYWVRCDDNSIDLACGVTQSAVSDRANAIARWNRRAE